MTGLLGHRFVLPALYLLSLSRAYLRHRNRGRRAIYQQMMNFYGRIWREAAAEMGAEYTPLGSGIAEVTAAGGAPRARVVENTCSIDDPVTIAVASDRPLTHKLLARNGLPVPRHAEFTLGQMDRAVAFMESVSRDCVVKPSRGTGGGRGVTTGLRRRSHLALASAAAAVYGDDLLIEEQLEGDNYRLLYLDGVLLDAYVRKPPTVVADGRSTVARLVRLANADRLRHGCGLSQFLLTVDQDMRRTLAKQGYSLRSVPPSGAVVTLKTVVNENRGADNMTATHLLCDSIIDDGARAAAALRVRFAGIDLVTPDPGVRLGESGGAILEVNSPPGFYYHYHKRDGVFPVAARVLETLLADPKALNRMGAPNGNGRAMKERNPC